MSGERQSGVSLSTHALVLHERDKLPVGEIAIRLFGSDTIQCRRRVDALIDEARLQMGRAH